MPESVKGRTLQQDTVDSVIAFYNNDEFTRQLPGKRDCVSIGKKQYMSKRLILCDLKELYAAFKEKTPGMKISFSKFASLRPKWCISVGPKGTHSVCVCSIHQNVKLMLSAISLEKEYHELLEMIVCNRDSKECMVHRCPSCPGVDNLIGFLRRKFSSNSEENETDEESSEDEDDDETVTFKQWTTTDRAELISQTVSIEEFITQLAEKLNNVTSHSYIARGQAAYLRTLKEELPSDEVIVLGDFAENYKFIIQDEIQGYHWNKQQCTLHPIVVYHKSEGSVTAKSLCFISDDLDHDVNMVYKVMSDTASYIKAIISKDINLIHYFSDGCAGQYKNCKHFLNLCYHQEDFSMQCIWNFFATSHGKSPCDGIGGTVKRLATRASLQRPVNNQILTAKEMFQFCEKEIHGIKFMYLTAAEVADVRQKLAERFLIAKTIPGTRGFHQFTPLSVCSIAAKRVSEEADYTLTFNFVNLPNKEKLDLRPAQFLICIYDEQYWLGMVSEVDKENEDILVKFMHPHFPARSFKWPNRDDVCWVPNLHIVCSTKTPSLSTVTARQYTFDTAELETIRNCIDKHMSH